MKSLSLYLKHPRYIGLAVLKRMCWLPDSVFLRVRFLLENKQILKLSHPKSFQEKIQWLKLYRREPIFTTMVDKYAVKEYVASKIGSEYIIPTIGVWNSFDEIDFDSLPNQFVLKTTHGGGNGGVVICRDKATFYREVARERLNNSLKTDIYSDFREWPYKNVPRRIIAEEYLSQPEKADLTDYKIFCFNGKPQYIQVIQDRNTHESIDFFDTEWKHQEFYGLNPKAKQALLPVPRPQQLKKMIELAAILSNETEFLRVDLYCVENRVFFGELTFFPASGFGTFTPKEWNMKLGDLLKLNFLK